MGKGQRQKGYREERMLVLELAKGGWEARRVPLSGASKYEKGDVVATKEGTTLRLEKKSRKGTFASLYAAYAELKKEFKSSLATLVLSGGTGGGVLIDITDNLDDFLPELGYMPAYRPITQLSTSPAAVRALKRLLSFRKWVGEADLLVLRDNNKPHLFIRYR